MEVLKLTEYVDGSSSVSRSLTRSLDQIEVSNDGDMDIQVSVNDYVMVVRPGEVIVEFLPKFTSYSITSDGVPFRAWVRSKEDI